MGRPDVEAAKRAIARLDIRPGSVWRVDTQGPDAREFFEALADEFAKRGAALLGLAPEAALDEVPEEALRELGYVPAAEGPEGTIPIGFHAFAQLVRRLEAAEDVCVVLAWAPVRDRTDREKAVTNLWQRWQAIVGDDRTRPDRNPHLGDERIRELAAERDEKRRQTIERFSEAAETEGGSSGS